MISYLLALALIWASPSDPNAARRAYSACLEQLVKVNAEKKVPPAEFDALVTTACSDKAEAFRKIMVASDVARGTSRAVAEQGVAEELADYRTSIKDDYRLYVPDPAPTETATATPAPAPAPQQ